MSRPVHFEIQADDPARAQAFYGQLFGWTFQKWGEHDYWLIRTGEGQPGIDGGLLPRMGGPLDRSKMHPVIGFVCTMGVDDVDASMAKATSLGGEVAVPKMPVQGVGWLAYCKDPGGNVFGLKIRRRGDFSFSRREKGGPRAPERSGGPRGRTRG